MNELEIIRSSTRTPSTSVSSGLHPATTISVLKTTPEEVFTTVVTAMTIRVSLDPSASSRMLSSNPRRSRWTRVQDALSVEGMAATREPSAKPPADAPIADGLVGVANAERHADPPDAATLADPVSTDGLADAAPASPLPKPTSEASRVELTIDSLRNYELVRPIPVFVESLGDRHYVAEVPDLNITTSASNLSEILIVLKDSVTQTYDRLRIRRNLDPEEARQLKMLETYVGKSKRSWLDRR
jgi:hypothetical protein